MVPCGSLLVIWKRCLNPVIVHTWPPDVPCGTLTVPAGSYRRICLGKAVFQKFENGGKWHHMAPYGRILLIWNRLLKPITGHTWSHDAILDCCTVLARFKCRIWIYDTMFQPLAILVDRPCGSHFDYQNRLLMPITEYTSSHDATVESCEVPARFKRRFCACGTICHVLQMVANGDIVSCGSHLPYSNAAIDGWAAQAYVIGYQATCPPSLGACLRFRSATQHRVSALLWWNRFRFLPVLTEFWWCQVRQVTDVDWYNILW